jgi:hypothetical protein
MRRHTLTPTVPDLILAASAALLCACHEPSGSQRPSGAMADAPSAPPAMAASDVASAGASPAPSAATSSISPVSEVARLGYTTYSNSRFLFSVDVPTFFVAEPPPTNGDGLTWKWGSRATMSAAGMNNDSLSTAELCKDYRTRAGVKSTSITKTSCWVTGVDAGRVYWERAVLSGDFLFELSLSYDEHLKQRFDPLVAHINASWKYRKCDPDHIDACGLCFRRCKSAADCDGREVCQPVTCWTPGAASMGEGCVNPDDEFSLRPGALVEHE